MGYLITALRTISAPTNSYQHPSAACTRFGWTTFGGTIPQPRAVVSNLSSVHHVQRLEEEDDLKALFYSDVAGVKPTCAYVCSDKELAEAKFLKHAKTTTEITDERRIRVRMPWRDGYPDALPFNKEKTVARMYQQGKRLETQRTPSRVQQRNIQYLDSRIRKSTHTCRSKRRSWVVSRTPCCLPRGQVQHESPHRLERCRTVQGCVAQ